MDSNSTPLSSTSGSRTFKDTNPKDAVGITKVPMSVLPWNVLFEVALGLFEGARKYRRHNYRVSGIRASVYFDAAQRHLGSWWEGSDIDPASRLSHVTKAIASLVVLRDAMQRNMWEDDRPPRTGMPNFEVQMEDFNEAAATIIEMYPNGEPPYTEQDDD